MAKYQPGQSGNLLGRPPMSEEEKGLRKVNRRFWEKIITKVLMLGKEGLKELCDDPTAISAEIMAARIALKCISTGDWRPIEFFMQRTIGKVPDKIEGPNGEPMSFIGLVQLAKKRKEE